MANQRYTGEIKSEDASTGYLPLNILSALDGVLCPTRIYPPAFWTHVNFQHPQFLQQLHSMSMRWVKNYPLLFVRRVSILTSLCCGILCFELLFQLSKLSSIFKKMWSSIKYMCWLQEHPHAIAAEGQGGQRRAPPPKSISSSVRAHASGLSGVPTSKLECQTALVPLNTKQNFELDLLKSPKPIQLMRLFSFKILNSLLQILKAQLTIWLSTVAKMYFFPHE